MNTHQCERADEALQLLLHALNTITSVNSDELDNIYSKAEQAADELTILLRDQSR